MLLFGHLGIGNQLVSHWTKRLALSAVLLGTVLPDILDKTLYYGMKFYTARESSEMGWIVGTRTFGHTGLFLLSLQAVAIWRKSRFLAAICFGIASHLVLDSLMDVLLSQRLTVPLLWPAPGWEFPVIPFKTMTEHAQHSLHPVLLGCEAIGILLLVIRLRKIKTT